MDLMETFKDGQRIQLEISDGQKRRIQVVGELLNAEGNYFARIPVEEGKGQLARETRVDIYPPLIHPAVGQGVDWLYLGHDEGVVMVPKHYWV